MEKDFVTIQLVNEAKGRGVFAKKTISPGTVVVSARVVTTHPTRTSHSIEAPSGAHVLMDEPAVLINHSCQPTSRPVPNHHGAYDFVAAWVIQPGDEITFDYAVTETVVVQPFPCECGSDSCRTMVTGKSTLHPGHGQKQASPSESAL